MGVVPSWKVNASRWIQAIEQNEIVSRQLATNRAIVEEVVALCPDTIIDLGCGEGWLVRTLTTHGLQANGADAIPDFIQYAREKGEERYFLASYEDILAGALKGYTFDVLTFNFSLFEKELTEELLAFTPQLLNDGGHIVIQTLHPMSQPPDTPYISHWEDNSWHGLGCGFTSPHAWYFRTMADWAHIIISSGFHLVKITEPLNPQTQRPVSLILTGKKV